MSDTPEKQHESTYQYDFHKRRLQHCESLIKEFESMTFSDADLNQEICRQIDYNKNSMILLKNRLEKLETLVSLYQKYPTLLWTDGLMLISKEDLKTLETEILTQEISDEAKMEIINWYDRERRVEQQFIR